MTAMPLFRLALLLGQLLLGFSCSQIQQTAAFGIFSNRKAHRARQTAQKFQDLMVGRRTINAFEERLPDNWEDALEQAIQAAIYAPNHKRTEPWRFHLLGPASIRKVCDLNAQLVSDKKGVAAGVKKLKRWLAMPGWLVVTCQKTTTTTTTSSDDDADMVIPTSLAREDYAACCCAVQNLCLSLHAHGLGTKWTTGPVNFDDRFAKAVGFSAEQEYVVGTIWFGTPTFQPSAPQKKLAPQNVLIRHT